MKIPQRLLLAFSLLLAIHANTSANAAEAPKPAAKKEEPKKKTADKEKESDEPKAKAYPYYGEVESVTSRTLTLKGNEKNGPRKLSINAQTRIVKDGNPAKLEDIKVGRWVGGGASKTEAGNERAVTINLSAKQKEAKPKAKAPEKEKKPASAPAPPAKKKAE